MLAAVLSDIPSWCSLLGALPTRRRENHPLSLWPKEARITKTEPHSYLGFFILIHPLQIKSAMLTIVSGVRNMTLFMSLPMERACAQPSEDREEGYGRWLEEPPEVKKEWLMQSYACTENEFCLSWKRFSFHRSVRKRESWPHGERRQPPRTRPHGDSSGRRARSSACVPLGLSPAQGRKPSMETTVLLIHHVRASRALHPPSVFHDRSPIVSHSF